MPTQRVSYPPEAYDRRMRVGVVTPNTSVRENPDGTTKRSGFPAGYFTHFGRLEVVHPERHIDVTVAMQIALFRVLSPMVMHRHRLESLVEGGPLETSRFRWTRVTFDLPRAGEHQGPYPMAAILASSACSYGQQSLETGLCEDTIDVFEQDTVLRKLGMATQRFAVHVLSGHHEERRGVKAAFERTFLAEPDDDQPGRKVIVEEYFRRQVQLTMVESDYPETGVDTQQNIHELVAMFDAECDVVALVRRPVDIQKPLTSVTVQGTPIG